jgi:hypothetical protein
LSECDRFPRRTLQAVTETIGGESDARSTELA